MAFDDKGKLDYQAVFGALALPLIFWCFVAGAVTLFGYPGVVCITPMAWLLSLTVAQTCIHRSNSPTERQRVKESALSGALLGFGQGLFFTIISYWGMRSDDLPRTLIISSIIISCGTLICAVLSAAFAYYIETKQNTFDQQNKEPPDE